MGIYCGEPIVLDDMLINILYQPKTKHKKCQPETGKENEK